VIDYKPIIDPTKFTTKIDNPYFPLVPGMVKVFDGSLGGVARHTVVTVTHDTKVIDGVTTLVIHDVVTSPGALVEDTWDWYAQDNLGNVWYFGEDAKAYETGNLVSTKGSWTAGVDGAQPGMVMQGSPQLNANYRQEYAKGAQDQATVLRLDGQTSVPAGSFTNLLVTVDFTALEPDKIENKFYAKGIGLVYAFGAKEALFTKLTSATH
jgi:hypothetical protein